MAIKYFDLKMLNLMAIVTFRLPNYNNWQPVKIHTKETLVFISKAKCQLISRTSKSFQTCYIE